MIDLHSHTDCSDGTSSPLQLIDLAVALKLEVLAITDHDTFDGFEAAKASAARQQLPLLCGVEVSTRLPGSQRSTHLLGYFFETPSPAFAAWIESLQQTRRQRNEQLFERLQAQGVSLTREQISAHAGRQLGRPHFAAALVAHGYVDTTREAFERYLGEDGTAWTQRDEPTTEEAISRIAASGGVASLAHPVRITRDMEQLRGVVAGLAAHGLAALECEHPEHSDEESAALRSIASAFDLAVTGGSDFHGENKPGIALGTGDGRLHVDASVYQMLKESHQRRRPVDENRRSAV